MRFWGAWIRQKSQIVIRITETFLTRPVCKLCTKLDLNCLKWNQTDTLKVALLFCWTCLREVWMLLGQDKSAAGSKSPCLCRLLLGPGSLVTPRSAQMRTQSESPFHRCCPSVPSYPAHKERWATRGWCHPWIVQVKYYLSSLARDVFLNPTLALRFGKDFSARFHACPQAWQCEQRLSWRASAFYCPFFSRLALSGLSPSFPLGRSLGALNQVFTGPQGHGQTWGWGQQRDAGRLNLDVAPAEQSRRWPPLAEPNAHAALCRSLSTVPSGIHPSLQPPDFSLKTLLCFCVFVQQALVGLLTERLLKMFPRAGGCWASSSGSAWGGLLVPSHQISVSYLK